MKVRRLLVVMVVATTACTAADTRVQPAESPAAAERPDSPETGDEPTRSSVNRDPGLACWSSPIEIEHGELSFGDITDELDLIDPLVGLHGHAAAFGDINDDQHLDLAVGTFGNRPPEAYEVRGALGPNPDRLLLGGQRFTMVDLPTELARTSGAVFADFDGDGDVDLFLVRHRGHRRQTDVPSIMLENRDGSLVPVAEPLPVEFLGRTPVVADFDGDGLLDVYVTEDRHGKTGGILLRNTGGFTFEDATDGSGLEQVFSLSAAAADLDGDGLPDLVTSERVFINRGGLVFEDVTPDGFGWTQIGVDDDPAGVAVGDVDNDGRPDIVVGQHYRSTVDRGEEVPVRLFLQDGSGFREATDAGLIPLPTLAPHVELADIDNDGWLDIVTSASAFGGEGPAVFRNRGTSPVSFEAPEGLGSQQYWVGAPVADVDRDGRLDVFAVEWEPSLPSRMFRNTSPGGHWLGVSVSGPGQGVGAIVEVESGDGRLLGRREISVSGGYASGGPPHVHFGLGDHQVVDVRITLPGESPVTLGDVEADRHLRWPDGC